MRRLSASWLTSIQRYSIVVMIVAVSAIYAAQTNRFLTPGNINNILLQAAAIAIAAIGGTFVITTADIDISIGSIVYLTMTVGWLAAAEPGGAYGIARDVGPLVYPVVLLAGALLGLINGLIMNMLKINSLIVTLATMSAYRGLGLWLIGSADKPVEGAVRALGRSQFLGVGWPVYLAVACAVAGTVVLGKTPLGRHIHAVGGSRRSAIETGLNADRIRLVCFSISGFCAALAGLIMIGRVGTLQAGSGKGFEFTIITAVVLGGTSLFGGRSSVFGSVLGAALLIMIDNGLNLVNASVYIYDIAKGLILVASITVDVVVTRLARPASIRLMNV